MPHTTRITNTKPFFFFFSFFPFFSQPHLLHLFSATSSLPFISPLFIFSSTQNTLLHIFSSFNASLSLSNSVSHPLNYSFIKGERVRTEKDQNERSRDLGKPKENEEQQRHRDGRRSLTEDWIRAEQTKGRHCIREDFAIF